MRCGDSHQVSGGYTFTSSPPFAGGGGKEEVSLGQEPPSRRASPKNSKADRWPQGERHFPARNLCAAARGCPRKGARAVAPVPQGGLPDRDRKLARAAGRRNRVHRTPAAECRLRKQ